MIKNLVIVVLVIVLVSFAYSSVKNSPQVGSGDKQESSQVADIVATTTGTTTDTSKTDSTAKSVSVSFMCKDKTHFIAEFADLNSTTATNQLKINVDGTIVRTLPHVAGDGQRFEDGMYTYVFAGEEATVITKTSGKVAQKTTTCEQPLDQNNAPMNFGDAAEGGGSVKSDLSIVVSESIVGTWQSHEDAKFTREFKSNGSVSDSYAGKVVSSGTWKVFTKEKPLKVSFPLEDAVYIQMKTSSSQVETFNFKVAKITPDELALVYMERGGTNTFKRIK